MTWKDDLDGKSSIEGILSISHFYNEDYSKKIPKKEINKDIKINYCLNNILEEFDTESDRKRIEEKIPLEKLENYSDLSRELRRKIIPDKSKEPEINPLQELWRLLIQFQEPKPVQLTPEEIKRLEEQKRVEAELRKEQERVNALRSKLAGRFGFSQLVALTEAEVQRILEPVVDTTAGRGYLFFRGKGLTFNLPQSMDGEFNAMIEEQARKFVKETYHADTRLPLGSLLDIFNLNSGDSTRHVLADAEGQKVKKNFPLGRIYRTVTVSGLRATLSPSDATLRLVYGLIGRDSGKVEEATRVFEKGKLDIVRDSMKSAGLAPKRIFEDISPYLKQLSQGDENAAKEILAYFRDNIKTEELTDLVSGVESLFRNEEAFSHLLIKMQDGRYEDMFDNSRLMACTFLPSGMHRESSLVYYHDPDIGLLHIVPRVIDKVLAPIGVAILANASDESGNKWLVVDSVEGGRELERVREKLWIPGVYQGILSVARDVGARNVMFNSSVYNGRPKRFLDHVAKQASQSRVKLMKAGMQDYSSLGVSQTHAKEALETWQKATNNEVNGYVSQLN